MLETICKKIGSEILQGKVNLTLAELMKLAPYCKKMILQNILGNVHETEAPTVSLFQAGETPWDGRTNRGSQSATFLARSKNRVVCRIG